MIELRRRRIAEDRLQRVRAERLAGNEARPHQGPGVVDEAGAQARDQGPKAELAEDERSKIQAEIAKPRDAVLDRGRSLRPTAA